MSSTDRLRQVRDVLLDAGYAYEGVAELLGPMASAALAREQVVPAERATRAGSPLETLVRLFLLGLPVEAAAVPLVLFEADLVARDGDSARALLDVRPYASDADEWYVVSDQRASRPLPDDHVLGVGGASTLLAQVTVRRPVARALDIGTGSGVQALHLSTHAGAVTATDTNPRALRLAAMTAELNGIDVELLAGSLMEPVAGREFDLIVSNPPFVISPRGHYTYRDGGLAGDALCAQLVGELPGFLAEGGVGQLLVNWEHHAGQDWRERVAGWLAGSGCDAWVIQREVQDPAEYAELWLADSGDSDPALYDAWLTDFEARGVEAVGFGIVTLRRSEAADPILRLQEARQAVEQPLGPHIAAWFDRQDFLRTAGDAQLLAHSFTVAPDALVERTERLHDGAEGAVLRLANGLRWSGPIDEIGAAIVAACDGTVPLGALFEAAAQAGELAVADVRAGGLGAVRQLVEEGFLLPALSE